MSDVERWYLTETGWLRSSSIDLNSMKLERDIFHVIKAGRHGLGGAATTEWDASGSSWDVERKANALMKKYGDLPKNELHEWYSQYSGPRL